MERLSHLLRYKYWLVAGVIVITLLGGFLLQNNTQTEEQTIERIEKRFKEEPESVSSSSSLEKVIIDIKGEVKLPGVYELTSEDRVINAVEKAGGTLSEADVTQLNLAAKLVDGQQIVVPKQGENATDSTSNNTTAGQKQVNINTADVTELQTVDGIGLKKAEAIIKYRSDNGSFKTIEDIKNITGIGEKMFERMKALITV